MELAIKTSIVNQAIAYAQEKELNNSEVARRSGVNISYISQMFRHIYTATVDGKPTEISDKQFMKLAEWAQISLVKQFWKDFPTIQFKYIIKTLEDCKKRPRTAIIIGPTGCGKTKTTDRFVNNQPLHTYRITVSSLYKLHDILDELGAKLDVKLSNYGGTRMPPKVKLEAIVQKLITIKHYGHTPLIIIDEGENLKSPVLNMLKGLYDAVKDHASIVIIGTDQLLTKLLCRRRNNLDALPQLWRRFKAGLVELPAFEKYRDFKLFFDEYVKDKGLQKLLLQICDNYGELFDYLEPAMREADEREVALSEDFFRVLFNMPKY